MDFLRRIEPAIIALLVRRQTIPPNHPRCPPQGANLRVYHHDWAHTSSTKLIPLPLVPSLRLRDACVWKFQTQNLLLLGGDSSTWVSVPYTGDARHCPAHQPRPLLPMASRGGELLGWKAETEFALRSAEVNGDRPQPSVCPVTFPYAGYVTSDCPWKRGRSGPGRGGALWDMSPGRHGTLRSDKALCRRVMEFCNCMLERPATAYRCARGDQACIIRGRWGEAMTGCARVHWSESIVVFGMLTTRTVQRSGRFMVLHRKQCRNGARILEGRLMSPESGVGIAD